MDAYVKLADRHRGIPSRPPSRDFNVGYSGSLIRRSFYGLPPFPDDPSYAVTPMPLSEDLIEWIELCHAIDCARGKFCMVELGAGFGRWVVNGAVAARRAGLDLELIAVEAERSHFAMLRQHFIDNDIDPDSHKLICAAVSDSARDVHFVQGHGDEWYGQAIIPAGSQFGNWSHATVEVTKAFPLSAILEDTQRVDFVDMDVQGAEADIIRGSLDAIRSKVARIHIGTHNHDVEHELRSLFASIAFECVSDFSCNGISETGFGPMLFDDGVQTWINTHILEN